jgi:hypothetical protein
MSPVSLSSVTQKALFPQISRKLVVVITSSGVGGIVVPHGLSYTPTAVIVGAIYDVTPATTGPIVNLDNIGANGQGAGVLMDATNVYLYATAGGTVELYVG